MTNAKRRKLWRARVADYRASELSVRAWCEKNGVTDHQLRYWLGRIGEESVLSDGARAVAGEGQDASAAWTRVEIVDDDASKGAVAPALETAFAIHIGPARIELRPGFDPALLSQVIRVVIASC